MYTKPPKHSQRVFTQHYRNSAGFTLIELLVVIAIIGILSSVVLASLNDARRKGNDAAIKSNLHSIQNQAEIFYMTNGNYGVDDALNVCSGISGLMFTVDLVIKAAIEAANAANGAGSVACNSSKKAYAVQVQLAGDNTKYWCVDSTGTARQEGAPMANTNYCP